ncbi:unnamed protein product [Hydatigera taeniaeformis]|uniref:Uncharacterized protein n=1 Tax=Hydatigena taeniaeformis TaxID=6205 RepID=A0A0R3WN48_HYDTA|nr:unnamed protein product [Hydatigera taeniaeformis]
MDLRYYLPIESNWCVVGSPLGDGAGRVVFVHTLAICDNRANSQGSSIPKDQAASSSVVQFSLVVRRPGAGSSGIGSGGGGASRPRLVPLAVPQSVPFAARLLRIEAEEREEKARLKERVLEMHMAQKEADETNCLNSDLLAQIPSNVNRDRWLKYNHPKRAPDAEAVFGTSSISLPPPPPSYVNYRNFRR